MPVELYPGFGYETPSPTPCIIPCLPTLCCMRNVTGCCKQNAAYKLTLLPMQQVASLKREEEKKKKAKAKKDRSKAKKEKATLDAAEKNEAASRAAERTRAAAAATAAAAIPSGAEPSADELNVSSPTYSVRPENSGSTFTLNPQIVN